MRAVITPGLPYPAPDPDGQDGLGTHLAGAAVTRDNANKGDTGSWCPWSP